jgi:dipeptide/tripeptide permease
MAEYSTGNKIPKLLHSNVRPWREIAAIALLLMDISWLIAWHASIFQPAERLSKASFYLLYGSMVAACYVFTYLFHWLQLRTNIRRAALLVILFCGYVVFWPTFKYWCLSPRGPSISWDRHN